MLWTGGRVISERIDSDDLSQLAGVIGHQRPVVLWENLHANDYDHARVYLGPYKGRSKHLLTSDPRYNFCGVLTNPNCEFEANFIALHTLAQWSLNSVCRFKKKETYPTSNKSESEMDVVTPSPDVRTTDEDEDDSRTQDLSLTAGEILCHDEEEEGMAISNASSQVKMDIEPEEYNYILGLNMAIKDWIDVLYLPNELESSEEVVPKAGRIKVDELTLIIDMYYLPYEYGQSAVRLLKRLSWLLSHIDLISRDHNISSSDSREWYINAMQFHSLHKDVTDAFEAFSSITNTSVLYSLHSYMNDIRSAISQANRFIRWKGINCESPDTFTGKHQEPWVNTGGLVAEIKRLMPISGQLDLYPISISPPSSSSSSSSVPSTPATASTATYIVSLYHPSDKANIYKYLTKRKKDEVTLYGSNYLSEMLSDDCQIRFLLRLYPEYCFLLCDESAELVGFVMATPSIDQFRHEINTRQYYIDGEMKESNASCCYAVSGQAITRTDNWPAYAVSYIRDDVTNTPVAALFNTLYRALTRVGVKGVHVALNDECDISRYRRYGYHHDDAGGNEEYSLIPGNVTLLYKQLNAGTTTSSTHGAAVYSEDGVVGNVIHRNVAGEHCYQGDNVDAEDQTKADT